LAELYGTAEARLRKQKKNGKSKIGNSPSDLNPKRLVHELQVHQVELETQNAELQEARDRVEALLENYTDLYDFAPVGYFTLAVTGGIRQVNLTGAHLVGVERARLVGQSFGMLVSSIQRPIFYSFLKQVFADQANRSIDVELLNRGTPRRMVRIKAQRAPSGVECRAVVVDITELHDEMEKVGVSEVRYRRLFEAAHDGVILIDPATRKITDANPFLARLLDYPREQLIGKELFEIGLLKDEAASREMFQKLKRQHEVRYDNLPLESQKGRQQEVEVVANLYQENDHAVIQCNIRDITERKHTEHELSEKARLLDLSHDAIIVRDMAGRIRYWNHGAEEIYGWSRAEALGKISNILLKTRYPIPLKKMTAELYRTGRWIGELVHTKRDGRRITVLARKTLDRDSRGHPAAVLENITDITERKAAEAAQLRMEILGTANLELRREIVRRQAVEQSLKKSEQHQRDLLAQSRRMQEQLRNLSREVLRAQEEERKRISRELHDVIAQTLTGINIRLATLKQEAGRSTEGFDRNLEKTQRVIGKSVDMVHRFARELRPAVLDDLGLIPALHSYMKDFAARTGLHTQLAAFAEVEQMEIAKRTVLFRVAQEALTNVSRHAQASRVEVGIKKIAGRLRMKIKDNGRSFDVERALHTKGGGRLGLLGMRERLEMIGGKFSVESIPGKGTTVHVEIPFAKAGKPLMPSAGTQIKSKISP
jgi:PAS domain S-box-containing protein